MSGTVQLQNLPPSPPMVEALAAEQEEPPHGYPQVATFMGDHPEMAMVRRFRGLNARNLLYLQAELVQIEKELLKCERDDANNKVDRYKQYYALDYKFLAAQEPGNTQLDLILKMRVKLKEYNDVLIQQTTLAKIANPSEYDTKTMQKWFERSDLANMPLEGDDSSIWANPGRIADGEGVSRHIPDLIAVSGQTSDLDRTTTWLAETFIPNWHQKVASRFNNGIRTYHESAVYRFTSIVATALSSLLPVLAIVVLYIVQNMPARLGIIAGFSAGFSFLLSLITNADRVANFSATAAFAAVQVVFVGNNGNSTSGPA